MWCIHSMEGCCWTGDISLFSEHLEHCEFDLLHCPGSCGYKVSRTLLQEHLSSSCKTKCSKQCEYCGNNYFVESEDTHTTSCLEVPIDCPNRCAIGQVTRNYLPYHLNEECELNMQPCPFKDVGCDLQVTKCRINKHLTDSLKTHLSQVNVALSHIQLTGIKCDEKMCSYDDKIKKYEDEINQLKAQIEQQRIEIQQNTEICSNDKIQEYKDELDQLKEQIKQHQEIQQNRPTEICSNNRIQEYKAELDQLKAQIKHQPREIHQNTEICSDDKIQEYKDELDQLKAQIKQQQIEIQQQNDEISQMIKEIKKLKENENELEITWTVEDFEDKMKSAKIQDSHILYSPAFYSHTNGYLMRGMLYLNGTHSGKSTHLSFFYQLTQGAYDDLLEWPFPYKVILTMLDQDSNPSDACNIELNIHDPSSKGNQKPTSTPNDGYGFPTFISHEDLYKRNYIKNDKLIFQIKVIRALIE